MGSLEQEKLYRWQRLWPVWAYKQILGSDSGPKLVVHPLVYPHPLTGLSVSDRLLINTLYFRIEVH